jgi:predicted nucleic acid-binding Zn ribbon protein
MCDVPPMSPRTCVVCREPLPSWARVDKTTCGPACRSRLSRARKASCNTFVTPLRAVAPRLGVAEGREPIGGQIAPPGASGMAGPRPANLVYPDRLVRVLAEGLRSIEERRAREQAERRNRAIIVPPKTEEPSDEPAPEP